MEIVIWSWWCPRGKGRHQQLFLPNMYNQLIISLLGESSPHSYQSSWDQRRQKGSLSHAAKTDQTIVLEMNIWPSEKISTIIIVAVGNPNLGWDCNELWRRQPPISLYCTNWTFYQISCLILIFCLNLEFASKQSFSFRFNSPGFLLVSVKVYFFVFHQLLYCSQPSPKQVFCHLTGGVSFQRKKTRRV